MNHRFILILLLALSFNVKSEEICTFTKQEKEFFEFTESHPFSDEYYSKESAAKYKKRLEDHESGKEVKYYINENAINIIKGNQLQKVLFKAKKEYKSYVPVDKTKWDREEHNLRYKYLKARKEYCDFSRTHYAIDW